MPFLQLTFDIGASDPEPLEEALLDAGALSITLEDAADDPVLEPAPGSTPLWPTVRINALFAAEVNVDSVVQHVQARCDAPAPQVRRIEDRAWEREWLKDFRPMRFGQHLWICPGGQRPPSEAVADPQRACIIELDPGLAFGTGTHATTALCLEWLDATDLSHAFVIDYGCGSGVLAIAALKLGAARALGIDIDPQALIASRDNALRNGVADRLALSTPEQLRPRTADIVLANILAEPLVQLAPALAQLVNPGGRIVLSGILSNQAAAVAAAYTPWFHIAPAVIREDWARLDGVRHSR